MTAQPKRAAIYIRVSDTGGRDTESAAYQTEETQEERCRHTALSQGYEVVEVIKDIDVSGRKWDREGLNRLMEMVRAGEIDAVIVFRVSRLGRNVRGALAVIDEMREHDVNLISNAEPFSLDSSMGRVLLTIMLGFAEYESDLRGENWLSARQGALARGVSSRKTPLGMRKIKGGEFAGRFELDPITGPIMREVYRRRAAGATYAELARYMDEVLPRENGLPWDPSSLSQRIPDRVYLGELTTTIGKVTHTIPGAHEALVTLEEWSAAQDVRPRPPASGQSAYPFLLTGGILCCAGCGRGMVGHSNATNDNAPVYSCRRRSRLGPCQAPATINAANVEEYVVDAIEDYLHRAQKVLAGRPRGEGSQAALEEAAVEAQAALLKASRDLNMKKLLGDEAWHEALAVHAHLRDLAVKEAAAGRDETALAKVLRLDVSEVLGDPELLRAALESAVVEATVRRGRGTLDERVSLTLRALDAPTVAGVLTV